MSKQSGFHLLPNNLTIAKSKIDGMGVFAIKDIPLGSDLGISHVYDEALDDDYNRTELGKFINHHEIPNSKANFYKQHPQLGDLKHIRIKTIKTIKKGEEITIKYIINQLKNPNWEIEYEVTQ
ncbi:MAG: SET domain-containing protein [Flavobacteriaceae bacterium]|nr:SET domain-containing protein [Flavobacteriaceae bacterium]MCY4215848.1 SET domain-containing protein [Flavobacteriaceae bacterium]MCY4254054.1 SET domain-containing protein [Flavobacteriaceae bacterium]